MKKRKQRPKKRTVKPDAIQNPTSNIRQVEYQEYQRYQKNLLALKKYYPELANLVEQTPLNQQYELVYTAKLPNLRHKPSNALYYSPPDLLRDAADQIKSLKLKNTRLALFLGFGLGYPLIYYMQHVAAQQNTNFILVLEKDPEVFKLAMQAVDLVPIIEHPGVKLLIGLAAEVLYPQMRQYLAEDSKYVLLKGIKPVYHISSLRLDKDYYLSALRAFKDSATHQILNFGNDPHDSLIGVENMLDNLGEIIFNPGISLLFNKFAGKPGIVVSTGPSLNKNKHLLKGLEDKAVIVAADASLKILLEMGVKPHLVVALERTLGILKLFNGIKTEDVQDVYFAACPVINPKVYEAFSAPRLIVFRNFDHFKWLGVDRGILDIKLSAGNMAFKVLEALGCNPIILIGQDLAFSRDGYTHASGATLGEKQTFFYDRGTLEVMGNDGKSILTSKVWYNFLKAYEMDVAGYTGTCINSTEGGAYIQGTQVMSFQEAINKYIQESFYPLTHIKKFLGSFSPFEVEKDRLRIAKLISITITDVERIIVFCRQGLEACQKYRDRLDAILNNQYRLEEIHKILPNIEDEIMLPKNKIFGQYRQTLQLFLMHVIQSYNIRFEIDLVAIPEKHDNQLLGKAEILLQQAEWYAVIGDLVAICLNSLLKAKEKLNDLMN